MATLTDEKGLRQAPVGLPSSGNSGPGKPSAGHSEDIELTGERAVYVHPETIDALFAEHREYLLQRHGTLELDPIPAMGDADPYNWTSRKLWCWITVEWNAFRIAVFYGPVWVVLLATMTIYVFIGRVVYANRKRLRELSGSASATGEPFPNPNAEPLASKTTEVHITTSALPSRPNNRPFDNHGLVGIAPYVVEIGSSRAYLPKEQGQTHSIANRAAWAYLKCAMMFFLALLITWVPATINRLATLADPNLVSFPLNFIEALFHPLQGFWNAIIYITTSVPACTTLYRRFFPARSSHRSFVPLNDVCAASALAPQVR
ncbi:hypothetical protein V501_04782 [Pseudogymnoascus sp. VKM F-4519 (FW-2642)]|nr:hypothetical protein V501_04782 [Pseudogymnoascus sp. VKM F-4519 (FW-2642)]